MFTGVQFRIIKALMKARRPIGIRILASMAGCSVVEVWRQVQKLVVLGLVKPLPKRSKYRIYVLNMESPLIKPLIDLINTVDSYEFIIGKNLIEAISSLNRYYVSGLFAVKGLIMDFVIPEGLLLIVDNMEKEKAYKIREWFKGIYRVDVVVRNIDSAYYIPADDILPYNRAIVEQAIADSAALFNLDPYNNIEVILLVLYRYVDNDVLIKALEEWGDEAKYRVWLTLLTGRSLGFPYTTDMFKPLKYCRDKFFEFLLASRVPRVLIPDRIVRGW
ncbi:MAG: hypothetical protein QW511_00530 [Candidatus Methanomethylicia archaeon]